MPRSDSDERVEGLDPRLDALAARLERLEAMLTGFASQFENLAHRIDQVSFDVKLDGERRMQILDARYAALDARWRILQEHLTEFDAHLGRVGREVTDRVELAVRGLENTRETIAGAIDYLRRAMRESDLFGFRREPEAVDEDAVAGPSDA